MVLMAKQPCMKTKGLRSIIKAITMVASKAPNSPTSSATQKDQFVDDNALDELHKGIRELKVEMNAVQKNQRPSTSRSIEGSKGFCNKMHLV